MELKEKDTITDILSKIMNEKKPCDILLKSGHRYKGTVQTLNNICVVLKLIGERSFFDATIRIDDISAIEVQIRNA